MKILICDGTEKSSPLDVSMKNYLLTKCPGWEIEIYDYAGNREELISKLAESDGLLTAFLAMDADLIRRSGEKLKCISVNATGYGNIDVSAAKKKQIAVAAMDEYCTEEVAVHTVSLLLALYRQLKHYTNEIEAEYRFRYDSAAPFHRLSQSSIGIFGFGRIGQRVAAICQALGMTVYVYEAKGHRKIAGQGIIPASAEEICNSCDFISNHMSQNKENQNFFNQNFFEKLKKKPIFINVGRGDTVDEDALVWALDAGLLGGAGLDVLKDEEPDLADSPLTGRENVILTPHAAFYSKETVLELQTRAADNLMYYLQGQKDRVRSIISEGK